MRKLFVLFILTWMTACATDEPVRIVESRPVAAVAMPAPAPPPTEIVLMAPPPPPPALYPEAGSLNLEAKASVVVREFLYPKDKITSPYANLILFSKKPVNKASREVYLNICENWKASFPEVTEVNIKDIPKEFKVISFYWMLKKDKLDTSSCEVLVDNYDYARAQIFLTTMKLKVNKSQMVCRLPTGFVIMDISALRKTTDIELAIKSWQKHMTIVPSENGVVRIYTLYDSIKAVLGAIGGLVTLK